MENLSSPSVLRTKFLITSSKSGIKDTRKKIVEVQVDGMLTSEDAKDPLSVVQPGNVFVGTDNPRRIWIEFRISNGLHLSQKNLSYRDLVRMVEKLEVLC